MSKYDISEIGQCGSPIKSASRNAYIKKSKEWRLATQDYVRGHEFIIKMTQG